jgi:hypothetical protein
MQVRNLFYNREQLQRHIDTIENLLAITLSQASRRELHRLLAEAQLLACAGRTNAERLTLAERAFASAQLSGDVLLVAAVLSHLGQQYNFRIHQPDVAEHYLSMAAQSARSDRLLSGWIAAQRAESAAMEQRRGDVSRFLHQAEDFTSALNTSTDDRFYTAWSTASLLAYQGTCYLHLQSYKEAVNLFENTPLEALSRGRQVVPLEALPNVKTTEGQIFSGSSNDCCEIHLGRCVVIQGLMRPFVAVELEIAV